MKTTKGALPRARGKKAAKPAESETETETELELDQEAEADDQLRDAFGEIPEGAVVIDVWRKSEGQRDAFCSQFKADEWELEAVARRHGGGSYLAKFRKLNDRNQRTFAGQRRFEIDPARKPVGETPAAGAAASSTPPGELGQLQAFYAAQTKAAMDQAEMMTAFKMKIMASAMSDSGGSSNTGELIVKMIAAITPLITLLMSRKDSGALTPRDLLEFSRDLKASMAPGSSIKDTLELVGQAKELMGGDSQAPTWLPAVEKLLAVAEKAIDRRPEAKALNAGTQEPEKEPAVIGHPFFQFLAPAMPDLINQAAADNDPDTYARMLLDRVEPAHRPELGKFINRPEVLEELLAVFPDAAPYKPWFGELVDRAREILDAPARTPRGGK